MFESFFSNISSTLNSILAIIIVIIVIYVICLCIFAIGLRKNFVFYFIMRDQIRLAHWLIRSTVKFYRYHWRFALGLYSFLTLYLVFYSALPGWADIHTLQKHLISIFSALMITTTAALLAKRKMKWSLRLAPTTTASITAIVAYYLYSESMYLVPQPLLQPFPLELVALIAVPSIITIALIKKLHWRIKTRHQSDEVYLNLQETTSNNNPNPNSNSNPHHPGNVDNGVYQSSHFLKASRSLSKIEKAYGVRGRKEQTSHTFGGARNLEEGDLSEYLESERKRTEKNLERLFPKEERSEGVERKRKREDF